MNKEKKGGIIDGEWEWECSERMEGMKWRRRCLIHFESKGGGLEERDNPFPAQVNGDRIRPLVTLPFTRAAAEPLNVRLSLPPSRPFCQPRDNIQSGKNLFRSVDLLLPLRRMPQAAEKSPSASTLCRIRGGAGPIRTPNQRAFSTRSRSERPVTPNWIPRGGFA